MSRPYMHVETLPNLRDGGTDDRPTRTRVEVFVRRGEPTVSLRQPWRWSAYSRDQVQVLVDGLQDWLDDTDPAG